MYSQPGNNLLENSPTSRYVDGGRVHGAATTLVGEPDIWNVKVWETDF